MRAPAVLLATFVAAIAAGHPHDDWSRARDVVNRFAVAYNASDTDALAGLLAEDFTGLGRSRTGWLAVVAENGGSGQIDLSHATYTYPDSEPRQGGAARQGGTDILVAPILDGFSSFGVRLASRDGVWQVVAIEPASLPEGAWPALPEHAITQPVDFRLTDGAGTPVHARVHIADSQGVYWPPRGHQKNVPVGWRVDVGGDVVVDGTTWAYVRPAFTADLPAGSYTIEVAKGMEFETATAAFGVASAAEKPAAPVAVTIDRWIDMAARGWYSGDTHVHFLGEQSAMLEARAEQVNVVNVLATKWGELITDATRVTGEPSIVSTRDHIVYYNEETRHRWLGHTILQRIRELVFPLSWGGPTEGVPGGFDYPPMAYQADRAHAQDALVTWAHFPFPGGEAAVDIALGKIDTVDLFTWGNAFADAFGAPGSVDTWYKFLNTGSRLPATAGTDKMLNRQVIGSVRTYAYLGAAALSYDGWIDAIASGRTFVTTGPLLTLTADDLPVGATLKRAAGDQVMLVADLNVPEGYPADVLEVVYNGRVLRSLPITAGGHSLAFRVPVSDSGWFAARVRGETLMPYQRWLLLGAEGIPAMAHTSPIYVTVDNQPTWSDEDAAYLAALVERAIGWARTKARFQRDEQRAEMIALFERALAHYRR